MDNDLDIDRTWIDIAIYTWTGAKAWKRTWAFDGNKDKKEAGTGIGTRARTLLYN